MVETYVRFQPFQLKEDMTLAPLTRKAEINRKALDSLTLTDDNQVRLVPVVLENID